MIPDREGVQEAKYIFAKPLCSTKIFWVYGGQANIVFQRLSTSVSHRHVPATFLPQRPIEYSSGRTGVLRYTIGPLAMT